MAVETKNKIETRNPLTKLLIHAVVTDSTKLAKACISLGADVMVRGAQNNTLLHICTSKSMATVLLRGGAKIDARNNLQQTPLHTSMRRALLELTSLLIQHNADVNAQEIDGTTPLDLAQDPEINSSLLSHKANPNLQDKRGDTALHLALRDKGTPIVAKLMKTGADKYIRNAAGNTAVDELCFRIKRTEDELAKMARALQPGWTLNRQKYEECETSSKNTTTVTTIKSRAYTQK